MNAETLISSVDAEAAQFEKWFGKSGDAVLVCTRDRVVQFRNQPAKRLFAALGVDLIGQYLGDLLGDAESDETRRLYRAVIEQKTGARFEVFDERLQRWLAVSLSPLEGQRFVVTLYDTSAHRLAHEQLQRSEREMRDFFENAAVALHCVDERGTILRCNRAELELLGYSADEYLGRNIADFHVDRDTIDDILNCLTGGRTLHNREAKLRCRDGSIKHVMISSNVLWEEGRFVHTRCFTRDISDLKKAEASLRESEERLRLVCQASGVGAWEWRGADNSVFWSPEYRNIYGFGPDEPPTFERGMEMVLPEDRARILAEVQRAFAERTPYRTEHRILHPTKGLRWIEAIGHTYTDEQGKPKRMLGAVIDITEKREALHALKEADARKDQFLATLAHELRNPLAPIRNSIELLKRGGATGESAQQVLTIIDRQSRHLSRLIDDLMEVSRISQGRVQLQKDVLDLKEIVHIAVEASKPNIDAAQHTLNIDMTSEGVKVEGDGLRLAQVICNVINNAAKYTQKGGVLSIIVRLNEERAEIAVKDNGIGIAPDDLPRIFDLFVQIPNARHTQTGLGIGLSLVRTLVEMHGGIVRAHSAGLGHGTEVTIELPLAKEALQEAASIQQLATSI